MFINFAKNGDYYAMKHLELGFVGFGLIGGSIARSLKKQNEDVSVHVYSRRKNPALDEGMAEGIILSGMKLMSVFPPATSFFSVRRF